MGLPGTRVRQHRESSAYAELIALDVAVSFSDQEPSWRELEMRNAIGQLLLTYPIRPEFALAAA